MKNTAKSEEVTKEIKRLLKKNFKPSTIKNLFREFNVSLNKEQKQLLK